MTKNVIQPGHTGISRRHIKLITIAISLTPYKDTGHGR